MGCSASDFVKWCQVFKIPLDPPSPGPYLPLAGGTMSGPINMGSHTITALPNAVAGTDAVSYQFMQAYILTVLGGNPGYVMLGNASSSLTPTPFTGAITVDDTGVTSFEPAADGTLLSNITGSSAAPTYNGLSAIFDAIFGNSSGDILSRGASAWTASMTLPTSVQANITELGAQAQALSMGNFQINNVASPSSSTDAATKGYVDSLIAGLGPAGPVAAATTTNFSATYNNGSSGVGATLTATATGVVSFDGYTPSVGDRILFKNQTTGSENGIYSCTVAGAVGVAAVFTRTTDYDTPSNINDTGIVPVINGSTQANTGWYQINTVVAVGTTSLSYLQFGNSGTVTSITAGSGLSGGTITGSGTIAVLSQSNDTLMSNISGSTGTPTGNTLTAILDAIMGNTQGDMLVRGSGSWMALSPVAAAVLTTVSSVPTWASELSIALGGTGVGSVTTAPTASAWAGWDGNENFSANNFLAAQTSTATAGGTTTLTVASTYQQIFTGTANQTIQMPVVSTLVKGQSWLFINNSTGTLTIQSSGSNTITTVAAGQSAIVACIAITGTTAASWTAVQFGSSSGGGYLVPQITILSASSGTYNTPTNTVLLEIIAQGDGGGGAGGGGSNGTQGGGEGAKVHSILTSPASSYSYTIGQGGTGGNSAAGGNGTGTTFGSGITAGGGLGGSVGFGAASNNGGTPTGGNVENIPGQAGLLYNYAGSPYLGGAGGGQGGGTGSSAAGGYGSPGVSGSGGGGGGSSSNAGAGGQGGSGSITVIAWVSASSVASGIVTSGVAGQLAVYGSSGTTISGQTTITAAQNGVTMTQKNGSNTGTSYTTASATLVDVDSSNLSYTVTIPTGYKLHISATATMVGTAGGSNEMDLAITDTSTSTVLNQVSMNPAVTGGGVPMCLNAIVTGDGASHTLRMQFSSSNSVTSSIINGVTNRSPTMTFILMPSN